MMIPELRGAALGWIAAASAAFLASYLRTTLGNDYVAFELAGLTVLPQRPRRWRWRWR